MQRCFIKVPLTSDTAGLLVEPGLTQTLPSELQTAGFSFHRNLYLRARALLSAFLDASALKVSWSLSSHLPFILLQLKTPKKREDPSEKLPRTTKGTRRGILMNFMMYTTAPKRTVFT